MTPMKTQISWDQFLEISTGGMILEPSPIGGSLGITLDGVADGSPK